MLNVLQVVTDLSWPGGDHVYICKLLEYLAPKYRGELTFHLAQIREHGGSENTHYYNLMSDLGVHVHTIEPLSYSPLAFQMPSFIRKLVLSHSIDVVHTHLFLTDLAAVGARLGSEVFRSKLGSELSSSDFAIVREIVGSEIHELNRVYNDLLPLSVARGEPLTPTTFRHISTKHLGVVKSICHEHDIERLFEAQPARQQRAHRVNQYLQELVSKESDHVVAIGRDVFQTWRGINANSSYIPVSVVDSAELEKLAAARLTHEATLPRAGTKGVGGTHYLFVGRLVRKKSPETLVSAFCEHKKRFPLDTLTIVGGGSLRGECEAIAGSTHGIRFLDHLPRQEVFSLMADLDALCLFSLEEGLPLVIQEAMACAMPILASKAGGIADLVQDNTSGFLVEEVSVGSICEALGKFSSYSRDRQRAIGVAARVGVRSWNTAEAGFDAYAALYRALGEDGLMEEV